MPEVVEVCLTALWLNDELRNTVLSDIKILGGRYSRHTMPGLAEFKKANSYQIIKIDSKGKFMWFELIDKNNNALYILNKFGLSGEWGFDNQDHSNVEFSIKDGNKTRNVYFTDPRNFGTIVLTTDINKLNKELDKLGDDLLKTQFTNAEFYDRIDNYVKRGGKSIIKTRYNKEIIKILMDQTDKNGIGSGLGNYLSVSVLYHAKISPYTPIGKLHKNKSLANNLADSIRYVVKFAYLTANIGYLEHLDQGMVSFLNKLRKDISKNKNHPYNFQPTIKIKSGEEFKFEVYGQSEDPYGNPVKADKIIPGRTTYWAPAVQK
ncbi:formamidopyrimidine-DNA glycosylase [Indivirus ILV1]|uniref:DNA-formamidopyrimidine glycosylase n=1 Tax=Indivirus ILV1 TaxID=1977633 RepID=A0A1V0SD80_9VIRU|nr:formamidopyrimidine-DNA glycosylase [Indivirus ILV1]